MFSVDVERSRDRPGILIWMAEGSESLSEVLSDEQARTLRDKLTALLDEPKPEGT